MYSEKIPDDGQRNCQKNVEFYSKNKFEKLVHLVGFIIRITVDNHAWSHDHHHEKVREGARLTTKRFDGVRRVLVVENIQSVPGGMCQTSGECSLC